MTDFVGIKNALTKRSRRFGFVTFSVISTVDEVMENRPHFIQDRNPDLLKDHQYKLVILSLKFYAKIISLILSIMIRLEDILFIKENIFKC